MFGRQFYNSYSADLLCKKKAENDLAFPFTKSDAQQSCTAQNSKVFLKKFIFQKNQDIFDETCTTYPL